MSGNKTRIKINDNKGNLKGPLEIFLRNTERKL